MVSIVTPTHKKMTFWHITVLSVLCQECEDWEWIVLDNSEEPYFKKELDTLLEQYPKYKKHKKKKGIPLEEDLIWQIFIKITLGLTAIHKMKILHRDLKTLNIFLNKDMGIKIGDLGVAKELNQASFAKTLIGTPYYLSPEMCQDMPYNQKSDVWALGCILYELCTFRHPFNATNQGALIIKILNSNPEPIFNCYSSQLQYLVNQILEKNYEKRPNCWDLLNNPIIVEKAQQFGLYQDILDIFSYNNIITQNDYNRIVNITKQEIFSARKLLL